MKTRAILKALFTMTLSAAFLVSCGKDNKSASSRINPGTGYGYPGGTGFGNGSSLPANWVDQLMAENPCMNFANGAPTNARTRILINLQGMNINAGSMYAGITYEGDVGVVSNQNGGPVLEIFACQRPDLAPNSQGFIMSANGMPPVLNTSNNCAVSEITALDAGVNTQYGGYHFAFYPIYFDSVNKPAYGSSLCQY